ncbi:hypothetical protein ACFCX4_05390 [Kitasatospora sp. NPDC056327]|uniref:hypothetical protein n=1 Tax=Kitasatospora sp. NPDC056327 TaxID=3345785 RepID=UPI0035E0BEF7
MQQPAPPLDRPVQHPAPLLDRPVQHPAPLLDRPVQQPAPLLDRPVQHPLRLPHRRRPPGPTTSRPAGERTADTSSAPPTRCAAG